MSRRPLLAALVTALLMVLVAGCGGLPTSGAVQNGLALGDLSDVPARVLPDGPSFGAGPEQIVRGFLRAGVGFEDDHAVARSFLTSSAASAWHPDVGTMVHTGESGFGVQQRDGHAVQVSAHGQASIDSSGHYRELPVDSRIRATFTMAQVGGQWRISSLPDGFGLWLSAPELDRIYRPFAINYVTPGESRILVPDIRWFPVSSGLATSLARAQLDPVPDHLRGAVVSGVPAGTRLAVDAVPVETGRATVELSAMALTADSLARRRMWAQFLATLGQVPSVSQVSLEVEGSTLDFLGVPELPQSPADVGFTRASAPTGAAVLRQGTKLSRVDRAHLEDFGDRPRPAPPPDDLPAIPTGWVELAMSADGDQLAAVGGDHKDLGRWKGREFFMQPKFGTGLTRPSFDGQGRLWVAGRSGGQGRVWSLDTSRPLVLARPQVVDAPWLARRDVVAFRVASDHQRAVVISRDLGTGATILELTGIVRTPDGRPRSLATPERIGRTLTSVTDVTWLDDRTVAVIGQVGTKETLRPYVVPLGGEMEPLTAADGARSITTTDGERGLILVTDDGKVLQRAGIGWQPLSTGTGFVVPGD